MSTQGKVFPCISLEIGDFEGEALEKVMQLTDGQLQRMADYVGEWMYDGDQWEEAIASALEREIS